MERSQNQNKIVGNVRFFIFLSLSMLASSGGALSVGTFCPCLWRQQSMMLHRHCLQLSFLKYQHADCPSFIQLGAVNMELDGNNEVTEHIAEVPTKVSVPAAATAVIQTPKSGPFPLAPSQVDQVVKRTVPQGYHVSKDAKAAINKSANIFILYMEALISSERVGALHASKRHPPKRIIISAADVKKALQDAGMSHLLPQMTSNKRSR
jgi:hypothetical protein